jgi:hypothetical protein
VEPSQRVARLYRMGVGQVTQLLLVTNCYVEAYLARTLFAFLEVKAMVEMMPYACSTSNLQNIPGCFSPCVASQGRNSAK